MDLLPIALQSTHLRVRLEIPEHRCPLRTTRAPEQPPLPRLGRCNQRQLQRRYRRPGRIWHRRRSTRHQHPADFPGHGQLRVRRTRQPHPRPPGGNPEHRMDGLWENQSGDTHRHQHQTRSGVWLRRRRKQVMEEGHA